MKERVIVLTDINDEEKFGKERDDIESLVRLLLYSDVIDIGGLIAVTSCWLKKGARESNKECIKRVISAYSEVRDNLLVHSPDYPSAEYLMRVTKCGIPEYGKGFNSIEYQDNEGVKLIINEIKKDDERPLWFSVWGGINTLSEALWILEREEKKENFDKLLSKIYIYSVFDQDGAGRTIRDNYGDKLLYIVRPTPPGKARYYSGSTTEGISTELPGADNSIITNEWIKENIQNKGPLGSVYPDVVYIAEGDTPSYLHLIPNGLNIPNHPELGGWGGRYTKRIPERKEYKTREKHPIYAEAVDTIIGVDGKKYSTNASSLFRWRRDAQGDFLGRINWSVSPDYKDAKHNPIIKEKLVSLTIKAGEAIVLNTSCYSPDGDRLSYEWFNYKETGTYDGEITIINNGDKCNLFIPSDAKGKTLSIILRVSNSDILPLVSYARYFLKVI